MKWTKQTINNLFFVMGIAMIVVMLFTFDVSFAELWDHLCRAGYWLIPIVGVWLLVYAFNALCWREIICSNAERAASKISFVRIYRLTITGYALNYATPVGGLGGEPYRVMELSRDIDKEHAASSVILYAMMHFFSHFWFWFIAVLLYLLLWCIGDVPMNGAIAVVLSLISLFCILAFYVFSYGYKHGVVVRIIGWLGKMPGLKGWSRRFLVRHEETFRRVDQQIASLHRQDRRAFYKSLILEYLSRVIQCLEVMFMLLLFGIDCGRGLDGYTLLFLHSILIVALTSLFANLLGFLPMQLGGQEGGFLLSIASLGLSPAIGIFVSIISRVRQMIWILIGVLLMKIPSNK